MFEATQGGRKKKRKQISMVNQRLVRRTSHYAFDSGFENAQGYFFCLLFASDTLRIEQFAIHTAHVLFLISGISGYLNKLPPLFLLHVFLFERKS
jgi:hypothetical protein